MSNSDEKVLGEYELRYMKIYNGDQAQQSVDIKNIVASWNLIENIYDGYIHGTVSVFDTKNLIQEWKAVEGAGDGTFNGEERIEISYTDYFDTNRVENLFLYSVEMKQTRFLQSDQVQEYILHFCSFNRMIAGTQLIRKANGQGGKVSDFAKEIYESYFTSILPFKKELTVEDSSDNQRLVVPSYNPIETMQFLCRQATKSGTSSAFHFVETREKSYFATPEFLCQESLKRQQQMTDFSFGPGGQGGSDGGSKQIKNDLTFFIISQPDFSEQDESEQASIHHRMRQILGLKYNITSNTIDDYNKGSYYRRIIDLDFIHREVVAEEVKYTEVMGKYPEENKPRHSQQFVDAVMPEMYDVWVVKDWTNVTSEQRPDPINKEIYGTKKMNNIHLKNNAIEIVIYGRNNIFAGEVLTLNLYKIKERDESGELEKDEERSGKWFVTYCNNEFSGDGYKQTLRLSRAGTMQDLSTSQWKKIPRLTPDEQIANSPTFGPGAEGGAQQQQAQQEGQAQDGTTPQRSGDASGEDLAATAKQYEGMSESADQATLTNFMNENSGTAPLNINSPQGPWCAKYTNAVLGANGIQGTGSNLASSFNTYGTAVSAGNVRVGDIAVMGGGSHVGIVTSVSSTGIPTVTAGNTSNMVRTYTPSNITSIRRP